MDLDLLIKFKTVQKLAAGVSVLQAQPEHVMGIVEALGSSVALDDAKRFTQLMKLVSRDPNESLASFFTNGGFVKLFGAAEAGVPTSTVVRCKHCGELFIPS